jgi:hypothetical protein
MIEVNLNYRREHSTSLCSKRPGVIGDPSLLPIRQKREYATPRTPSGGPSWEMLALWSFVVFSFAALAFFLYVMWDKIRTDSAL